MKCPNSYEEYEELRDEGRLIILPCNPEDKIWIIQKCRTKCSYANQ